MGTNDISPMVSNGNCKYCGTMSFHLNRYSRYDNDLHLSYVN